MRTPGLGDCLVDVTLPVDLAGCGGAHDRLLQSEVMRSRTLYGGVQASYPPRRSARNDERPRQTGRDPEVEYHRQVEEVPRSQ